jgi:RNA polymerase sigma-70 factor (TIGR02943 family)
MKNELNPSGWLQLYGDYLFSLAMLKTRNQQLAEDLVQDSFLSAIKAKESFRGESSEKTWLTMILKNKIIDHYRKKDVLKELDDYLTTTEQSFHSSFFSEAKENYGHWTESTAPKDWLSKGADSKLMAIDFKQILEYCLEKMPAKLIPVFLARFIDEEESAAICKEFNISPSNYWVIIHRAKVLMRSCLEKNWVNP